MVHGGLRRVACLLVLGVCAMHPARAETVLTVMTFNAWGGGANEGRSIEDTAAVIRAAGADIVGVQETRPESPQCDAASRPPAGESIAARLAAVLGYRYHEQVKTNDALWANAILSRYPIGAATPNDLGVAIEVSRRRMPPMQPSCSVTSTSRHTATGLRRPPRPGANRSR